MISHDRLDIRQLGGFEVRRDGQTVDLPTRKALGLLALLALRPGVAVGRERLSNLLWSRSAPAQARASLRQALTQLRRVLLPQGTDLIQTGGDLVRLGPEHVQVDVAELETALDEHSPQSLVRAAALYRGDLLDGFVLHEAPFEDWLQFESERLRRRTLWALTRLLRQQVEAGDLESATLLGERLLELDPAAEDVHQALIRLDLNRGALGSAMRRFERCRGALAAALGVSPSAATLELVHRIRARPPPALRLPKTVSAPDASQPNAPGGGPGCSEGY